MATDRATQRSEGTAGALPSLARVLAVCAHPDDETFGLGAIISDLVDRGTRVDLLCFTRGGASTHGSGDLTWLRSHELRCAADVLGITEVTVHDHPDGRLDEVALDQLTGEVLAASDGAEALLVYDHGGVTGHPDHQRATDAALAAAHRRGTAVLAWTLPAHVADVLNAEFDASFTGRGDDEIDITLTVDRQRQLAALTCHRSQLIGNPLPTRRLELQGDEEALRDLAAASTTAVKHRTTNDHRRKAHGWDRSRRGSRR